MLSLAAMLLGLPLLGLSLAGRAIAPYLSFPPRTVAVSHAPFSWTVFVVLSALVIACVTPFVLRVLASSPARRAPELPRPLPAWGWAGLALLLVSWVLAWSRFDWLAPLQRHTFTPLWLGYVIVINALTWRRSGRCLLLDRPRRFLLLFPMSALFWWFFEFLNRFVRNWFYVGSGELDPWQYFFEATLAFSTVLPAVLSTRGYLATYPKLSVGLDRAWKVRTIPGLAPATLLVSGCVLAGIGVWPEQLYPMLWVAPLSILVALQALSRRRTILRPLRDGDWHDLWLAALAALVCGFFWELWNSRSLAHWEYVVPYVDRYPIFEMPLLGFAGYLPFGLQCLAVGQMLEPDAVTD